MKKFVIAAVLLVALAMVPGVTADTEFTVIGYLEDYLELDICQDGVPCSGAIPIPLERGETTTMDFTAEVFTSNDNDWWSVYINGANDGYMHDSITGYDLLTPMTVNSDFIEFVIQMPPQCVRYCDIAEEHGSCPNAFQIIQYVDPADESGLYEIELTFYGMLW